MIDDLLGPDGALARRAGFRYRPGQHALARLVARVLQDGGVALAEAQTGIGKTLAWLLPAALHSDRVVVSTATRALQGQVLDKDAPLAAELLGRPIALAVLKGRTNYLCLNRLEAVAQRPPVDPGARRRFDAVQAWARQTQVGDRAEVPGLPEDHPLWERLTVDSDRCLGTRCPQYEACFVTRARARAERAQVVVVNHHLYFADLAVRNAGGQVLPRHDVAIFDEAHALPDTAAPYFGCSLTSSRLERWVADALRLGDAEVDLAARSVAGAGETFFAMVRPAGARAAWDPLADGGPAEPAQHALDDALALAVTRLTQVAAQSDAALATLIRRAQQLRSDLDRFFSPEPGGGRVFFREQRGRHTHLSMQPVEPGEALRDSLFAHLRACVLTSATLRSDDTFDFPRARLGLPADAESHAFPSPFDFARQARLYLPQGMPAPAHPRFVDAVAEQVSGLVRLTAGRAFVLFTSHRNLRAVADRVRGRLGYPTLVQGDAPRDHLLTRFRAQPSVLLATQSFWEGVDVVGDALSLVIIDKLPFAAPDDPVLQARAAAVKQAGGDPFRDLAIPHAVLALRQGIGRLLRSAQDRGVVAILDPRLAQRGYGKKILRGLPPIPAVRDAAILDAWWHASN